MKKILMMLAICGAVSFTMASCGGGEADGSADATEEEHDHGDGHDHADGEEHSH